MNDDNDEEVYGGTCRLCGEPVGDEDTLFDTREQRGGPMHQRCADENRLSGHRPAQRNEPNVAQLCEHDPCACLCRAASFNEPRSL